MSMRGKRLSTRLFAAIFGASLAVLLIAAAAMVAVSWTIYEGNAEDALSAQVEVTSSRLSGKTEQQMIQDLKTPQLAQTRVTLVSPGGTVLYDNYADASTLENHGSRQEIAAASAGGRSVTLRHSETTGVDTLYAAVVIDDRGYVLRLAEERTSLPMYLGAMVAPLAAIVVLIIAVSLLLARFLARRIAAPLLSIDLESPLAGAAYVEVEPLLSRIETQRNELHAKNEQLGKTVQLRREFAGNVSHEMKSPLQVIGGYAELIESGMAKGEDAQRFAGIIRQESASMRTLVDDVLTLSRLDERLQQDESVFDLVVVCRRAVARLGVDVDFKVPDVALSKGSEALAEQLVYNLVDNAARHGQPDGAIEIALELDDASWKLTVSDDGPGIPSEHWDRVFERFYRVDSSRSRDTGGTGLGLAIVKHAAESMGGSVAVVEPKLGGATVEVVLPAI